MFSKYSFFITENNFKDVHLPRQRFGQCMHGARRRAVKLSETLPKRFKPQIKYVQKSNVYNADRLH